MFYRQKLGHSQMINEIGRAEKIIFLGSGGKGELDRKGKGELWGRLG